MCKLRVKTQCGHGGWNIYSRCISWSVTNAAVDFICMLTFTTSIAVQNNNKIKKCIFNAPRCRSSTRLFNSESHLCETRSDAFSSTEKKKSNGVNLSGSYTEEINMNLLLFPPRRSHTGGGLRASCLISVALRDTGIGWWEIPVCLSVSGLPPPIPPLLFFFEMKDWITFFEMSLLRTFF